MTLHSVLNSQVNKFHSSQMYLTPTHLPSTPNVPNDFADGLSVPKISSIKLFKKNSTHYRKILKIAFQTKSLISKLDSFPNCKMTRQPQKNEPKQHIFHNVDSIITSIREIKDHMTQLEKTIAYMSRENHSIKTQIGNLQSDVKRLTKTTLQLRVPLPSVTFNL